MTPGNRCISSAVGLTYASPLAYTADVLGEQHGTELLEPGWVVWCGLSARLDPFNLHGGRTPHSRGRLRRRLPRHETGIPADKRRY